MIKYRIQLVTVWSIWSVALFCLLFLQTILGKFGDRFIEAWTWFGQVSIAPLSLIVAIILLNKKVQEWKQKATYNVLPGRLQSKVKLLDKLLNLLDEKVDRLKSADMIETDPTIRLKYEKQLEQVKLEQEQIEMERLAIENNAKGFIASPFWLKFTFWLSIIYQISVVLVIF